jgi:hypothetical protein
LLSFLSSFPRNAVHKHDLKLFLLFASWPCNQKSENSHCSDSQFSLIKEVSPLAALIEEEAVMTDERKQALISKQAGTNK